MTKPVDFAKLSEPDYTNEEMIVSVVQEQI